MTLAIERHDGRLWLVAYETTTSPHCILLARFNTDEAAAIYTAANARAMCFAREVGHGGLG